MGVDAAHNWIIDAIRGIEPIDETADRFTCVEDGTGAEARLEQLSGDRHFVVDLTGLPLDDGETGRQFGRLRANFTVRVRYEARGDRALDQRRIARDVASLTDALLGDGDYGTSGIITIESPDGADLESIESPEGVELYLELTLSADVLYHEEALG